MRDRYNIIPVTVSVLLHVLLFGGLFVVLDFTSPSRPPVPLAIEATLVSEAELRQPPPVREPEPEPEPLPPEPQPEPEPEPEPEPDRAEQQRLRLEEEKRQADLAAEQERIRQQQEEDRRRREAEEAERKRREEAELERQRQERERQRLEDIERQRQENERARRAAEEAQITRRREQEMQAEEQRLAALAANDLARYQFAIQQAITRQFIRPASAPENLECVVNVRQIPGGQVVDVRIARCNGDDAVQRAIVAAVNKASPLPLPANPNLFERDLQILFKPEQ